MTSSREKLQNCGRGFGTTTDGKPAGIRARAEHGAVGGVVALRAPPDVVEHVHRQLVGRLAVAGKAHDQRKDGAMRPFVEVVQRELVACGDRLHECEPSLLRFARPGFVGISKNSKKLFCSTPFVQ